MHVRAATDADSPAIARIQIASPEAAQWDPSGYPVVLATLQNQVAGFLSWRETAPDEAEVLNLAIDPAHRRQGIALALLASIPMPLLFLEVRESNAAARALYRKAGFTECGVRFAYYSSPQESAIVMRLKR